MENAPLNKAHREFRRADRFLHHGKFDEAIQCHKDIVSYLTEAMSLTENEIALQSLQAQRRHSQKQVELIGKRKEICDNYKKALMERTSSDYSGSETQQFDEPLQDVILRKIEEHDSLIVHLVKKGNASDSESLKSYSDIDEKNTMFDMLDYSNATLQGTKLPKNEGTTIEELNILSGQLKYLIQQLVSQLEDRNKEIASLKSRIKQLESEKQKAQSKSDSSLKVITDSSEGTSPYVISPCSELSPDLRDPRIFPPLTPLELPNLYLKFETVCSVSANSADQ